MVRSHPLLTRAGLADPYPYLHRLRRDDPVHWDEVLGGWVLTRYDDVMAAFRDERLSSDRISAFYEQRLSTERREILAPTYQNLSRWMVFNDPPEHTRLRRLVHKAFTPRIVDQLRPRIQQLVDELLADPLERGSMDLVSELASPLPAIVIAEMLGVPAADRDRFVGWSDDITMIVFGALDVTDRHERAQQGIIGLSAYLRDLITARRAAPRDDLLSGLVAAEEEGDSLTENEIVSTCTLLLFGGHETTTNHIANGMLSLLSHRDQLEAVRADPALMRMGVEELLRHEGPSRAQVRVASTDLTVRGRHISEGERVYLSIAAANRDPEHFPDPDRLDVSRGGLSHVAFGFGLHYCLGASLARVEGQIAFTNLVQRLDGPELTTAPADLPWHPTVLSRGVRCLPITFTAS
jgi:cytochrome P450